MSEQRQQESYTLRSATDEPTGWVGWILFAGVMFILVGSFQAIAGLVGIFNDKVYVVPSKDLVVNVDYTTWGWVHLVLGVLAIGAGLGVMAGQMWARVYGIVLAGVSALANLAFLSAYPIWCTMMITMDVLVIWALSVHGREVKL